MQLYDTTVYIIYDCEKSHRETKKKAWCIHSALNLMLNIYVRPAFSMYTEKKWRQVDVAVN